MEYTLPCKIGDIVYRVIYKSIEKSIVEYFIIDENGVMVIFESSWPFDRANVDEFGKTIFFSEEEAEKALRGE